MQTNYTSIETSKSLQEIGYKADTDMYWYKIDSLTMQDINHYEFGNLTTESIKYDLIPAYSIAHLLDVLPEQIDGVFYEISKVSDVYYISYDTYAKIDKYYTTEDKSFADCLAKMLIHLIKEKII